MAAFYNEYIILFYKELFPQVCNIHIGTIHGFLIRQQTNKLHVRRGETEKVLLSQKQSTLREWLKLGTKLVILTKFGFHLTHIVGHSRVRYWFMYI